MKTHILSIIIALIFSLNVSAQEATNRSSDALIYSFFINSVPDGCDLPLVGFINMGRGSHTSAHVGFINMVHQNITGTQVGFVNLAGGYVHGWQIGFVNSTPRDVFGAQVGFINVSSDSVTGGQVGFVNTCADSLTGTQIGFVNTVTHKANGFQVGFVNTAKTLSGSQVGFVNVVDSLERGVPIGFLSIVRKGGYHAVELSVTEMHPVNLAYKIGISRLYTTFNLSYNPNNEQALAFGAGFGSILPMGSKLYFNPEYITQTLLFDDFQQQSSFTPNFGYQFNSHLSVLAGPSLVWQYSDHKEPLVDPLFSFSKTTFTNNRGRLLTGARLALRYKF